MFDVRCKLSVACCQLFVVSCGDKSSQLIADRLKVIRFRVQGSRFKVKGTTVQGIEEQVIDAGGWRRTYSQLPNLSTSTLSPQFSLLSPRYSVLLSPDGFSSIDFPQGVT